MHSTSGDSKKIGFLSQNKRKKDFFGSKGRKYVLRIDRHVCLQLKITFCKYLMKIYFDMVEEKGIQINNETK